MATPVIEWNACSAEKIEFPPTKLDPSLTVWAVKSDVRKQMYLLTYFLTLENAENCGILLQNQNLDLA